MDHENASCIKPTLDFGAYLVYISVTQREYDKKDGINICP